MNCMIFNLIFFDFERSDLTQQGCRLLPFGHSPLPTPPFVGGEQPLILEGEDVTLASGDWLRGYGRCAQNQIDLRF